MTQVLSLSQPRALAVKPQSPGCKSEASDIEIQRNRSVSPGRCKRTQVGSNEPLRVDFGERRKLSVHSKDRVKQGHLADPAQNPTGMNLRCLPGFQEAETLAGQPTTVHAISLQIRLETWGRTSFAYTPNRYVLCSCTCEADIHKNCHHRRPAGKRRSRCLSTAALQEPCRQVRMSCCSSSLPCL